MMASYLYTAWFRDELAQPDEQDFEWPACFVVEAVGAEHAQAWGDHLAKDFSRRRGTEAFLHSKVEQAAKYQHELPCVRDGQQATDADIGW